MSLSENPRTEKQANPALRLSVGTFNLKRGGWSEQDRRHDHAKLLDTLRLAPPPHILMLSECTYYGAFNAQPLWEATRLLDELWAGTDFYRPFLSTVRGSRNVPGLFVSSRHVQPVRWHDVQDPHTRELFWNTLEARIAGNQIYLQSVHWNGAKGPEWFAIQSALSGQLAAKPSFLAGDFNCTSSASGELLPQDWEQSCQDFPLRRRQKGIRTSGRWVLNTEPMDDLLIDGFWDAGAEAGDFTTTTDEKNGSASLRIDRILGSHLLPARLVPDSYRVIKSPGGKEVSDHRYVYCELDFAPRTAEQG